MYIVCNTTKRGSIKHLISKESLFPQKRTLSMILSIAADYTINKRCNKYLCDDDLFPDCDCGDYEEELTCNKASKVVNACQPSTMFPSTNIRILWIVQ